MNNPKIKMFKIFNNKNNKIYYVPSYNKEDALTQVNALNGKARTYSLKERNFFKKVLTESKSPIIVRA